MLNWHLLYTKPNAEAQVTAALQARQIEVFYPTVRVDKPRPGRRATRPYFPCYVFAYVNLAELGLSRLQYVRGLRRVVFFGDKPAILYADEIEKIRRDIQKPMVVDGSGGILQHGDPVELLEEPFSEFDAIFDERLSPEGRVRVLLRYLERRANGQRAKVRYTPVVLEADLVRKKIVPRPAAEQPKA